MTFRKRSNASFSPFILRRSRAFAANRLLRKTTGFVVGGFFGLHDDSVLALPLDFLRVFMSVSLSLDLYELSLRSQSQDGEQCVEFVTNGLIVGQTLGYPLKQDLSYV